MKRLSSVASQLLPIAFILMAVVALAQFWMQHTPDPAKISVLLRPAGLFLQRFAWSVLALATAFWLFTFAGLLHARKGNGLRFAEKEGFLMDILDRLTNRQKLEEKLAEEPAAIFIDADHLAQELKSRVIGQDLVCDDIAAQIRRRLALKQRGKPVGVFLLAGPPGTGKTYLAKCLAKALNRQLLHFDMTQFSAGGHAATQLFGSSKGYLGSDSYGKLTGSLRETPDAVVLLDEFEKAHGEVHKNFLTAWNDGFITEASDGRQISTSGAIFVLTTNAATDALQEVATRFASDADMERRSSVAALREAGFAPEVLSRIDRIFVFRALTGLDIARVTALEIEAMIKSYGLQIADAGIDPEILLDIMRRQQRLGTGASSRDLVRAVEEQIADSLIAAKQHGHTKVTVVAADGGVKAVPA